MTWTSHSKIARLMSSISAIYGKQGFQEQSTYMDFEIGGRMKP